MPTLGHDSSLDRDSQSVSQSASKSGVEDAEHPENVMALLVPAQQSAAFSVCSLEPGGGVCCSAQTFCCLSTATPFHCVNCHSVAHNQCAAAAVRAFAVVRVLDYCRRLPAVGSLAHDGYELLSLATAGCCSSRQSFASGVV